MPLVAIQSVQFPGTYIRIAGEGVTVATNGGGGDITTQTYIGQNETYSLVQNADGTVSFLSTLFPNVFIRLDGSTVPVGENGSGGGVVNAQFTAGPYEKFYIRQKASTPGTYQGVVGLESFQFAGRFLRLGSATGRANVQGVFQSTEEFEILVIG